MAGVTPRRSLRIPHTHTPKMSERKKGLFQSDSEPTQESLTMHRQLPVVDSESDSDDCDLGIISTLDSSSGDENNLKTPEKTIWCGTRNLTGRLLKENQDLKNFIKSPFTLKKYQTRYSCPENNGCSGSQSTPVTPHLQNHPGTPTSTHSCASVHTTSSTSSKARKSLASLIADTESCSSSLKDLNFDSDSGTDSKENTPVKSIRKSTRKKKMTPKFQSFKGILAEQKRNSTSSPKSSFVNLTKMDFIDIISPTQMLKTPNSTSEVVMSPPKLGHNRRSVIEISESPETPCSNEKSHKRLHNESITDAGPNSKYIKLDTPSVPKARQSLFSSDRLKEILSTKLFYGKSNPDLNSSMTARISSAIESTHSNNRRSFTHSHSQSRRKRRPGQINLGVRHKIRKPKIHNKYNVMYVKNNSMNNSTVNNSNLNDSATSLKDKSMLNSSQDLDNDKTDPFGKEKQTIDELLSQWTEEEVPETEMLHVKTTPASEIPCFSSQVINETSKIFQPVTITRVTETAGLSQGSDVVIVELGSGNTTLPLITPNLPQNMTTQQDVVMSMGDHVSSHGDAPKGGEFLPVEGGYILVENGLQDEELTDLDEIERELKMLDEQILQMAQSNNINPEVVLASTEPVLPKETTTSTGLPDTTKEQKADKLFSIFSKPNPGTTTPTSKGSVNRRMILKSAKDQYVIDAGQKKFGATQCKECGVIYQIGDPQDEHDHLVHHNSTDVLKFNGWKEEYVVGTWEAARCIRVRGGEAGWKRVEKLLERIVHPQLGYDARLPGTNIPAYTAFLYIEKKQIIGCLIMEPKTTAYKFMPGDPDCCSVEGYPVRCGVSRLWTHVSYRRRGVAYRLLQCARTSFFYGEALDVSEIAFSAPTTAGKAFATAYCKTPNFYVYID